MELTPDGSRIYTVDSLFVNYLFILNAHLFWRISQANLGFAWDLPNFFYRSLIAKHDDTPFYIPDLISGPPTLPVKKFWSAPASAEMMQTENGPEKSAGVVIKS